MAACLLVGCGTVATPGGAIETQAPPTETATAAPTLAPTETPTATETPTITPSIIEITATYPPGIDSLDVRALSALCWVEARGMGNRALDACASIVSTVLARVDRHAFSDGTIQGTLRWGCGPETIHCHFPAYVTRGCDGIIAPCPFDDPDGMGFFVRTVVGVLMGTRSGPCDGFLYYGNQPFDTPECVIENDSQYINFHN